jgi:hypothetical protein
MPRGAADAGLGRSLSVAGAFSGAFVGGAGSVAAGFGASTSRVAPDVAALDGFVDGARVVVVVPRPVLRVVLVVGFAPTEAFGAALIVSVAVPFAVPFAVPWLDFAAGGTAALIGGGALAVGADAALACDVVVEVGAVAVPVADVPLATFVVGHRAP